MKKITVCFLPLILALSISVISLAEGETITQDSPQNSGEITVGYSVGVNYTLTIPASVTFSDSEKEIQRSLQVSDVILDEGSSIIVNLSSLNNFKMTYRGGEIGYSLLVNATAAPAENDFTILTVKAGEPSGWVLLDFLTNLNKNNVVYTGNYTDTLTFTVTVK